MANSDSSYGDSGDGSRPPPISSDRNLDEDKDKDVFSLNQKSQRNYKVRVAYVREVMRWSLYETVFSYLDEDKDGRISMSDIQRCLGWVGEYVDVDTLEKIFQNQSNLTYEEFFRSVEWEEEDKKVDDWLEVIRKYDKKRRSLVEERNRSLYRAFMKYEKDDDGSSITAEGLQKMLSDLEEKRTTEQCAKMIRSFYPNGDDVINFEEFKVLRFFSTFLKRVEYNTKRKNYPPGGRCGITTKIVGVRARSRGQGRED